MFLAGRAYAHANTDTFQAAVRGPDSSTVVSALLDILLLAGTCACFLIAVRVKSFLRDGTGYRAYKEFRPSPLREPSEIS